MTAADLSCHACSTAWEWKAGFPLFSHLLILSVLLQIYNISIVKCSLYQYVFVTGIFLALQLDIRSPF